MSNRLSIGHQKICGRVSMEMILRRYGISENEYHGTILDFVAEKEKVNIHQAAAKICEWFCLPRRYAGKVIFPLHKATKPSS